MFYCMLLVPVMFAGCQRDYFESQDISDMGSLKNGVVVSYCGDPLVLNLTADQELVVGDVTIGNNDEYIFVTFKVTGDWLLTNTKVFLGMTNAVIPVTKTGNPIRGKFTQDIDHVPYVKEFTHVFEIGDFKPEDLLKIAAHATVVTLGEVDDEIIITRQETAWGEGKLKFGGKAWGWYTMYSIQECPQCPDHVLVFRDVPAWESPNNEVVLGLLGFTPGTGPGTYEVLSSADFATKVLDPNHDLVIIVNDQPQTFYTAFAAVQANFWGFVENGGKMIFEAADNGWQSGDINSAGIIFPEGITLYSYAPSTNLIPDLTLPLVTGLTSPLTGSSASHNSFSNLPSGSITYCTDDVGVPTLFEFNYGTGKILFSSQCWEIFYMSPSFTYTVGKLMPRSYAYMTCKPFLPEAENEVMPQQLQEGTPISRR